MPRNPISETLIQITFNLIMEAEYNFSQGKRGAISPISTEKTKITIWLDNDVLEWFRNQVHLASGGNYQALINEALKQHIQNQQEPMEKRLGVL